MSHGRLVLGDLDLDGTGYSVYALGTDSGTDWGNPAPREVELRSFLADGSVVVTEGYGNRELMVAVEVSDSTSQTAAEAEAALMAELGKRNTLTAYPDDDVANPTVFEVITSSLTFVPDDLRESMQGAYNYMVRLVCEPWVRAESETTTAAIVPGSTVTVIDECSATTNWAAGSGSVVTASESDANTYVETNTPDASPDLTKTISSTNLSTTPYIRVDWNFVPTTSGDTTSINAYVNGTLMEKVSEEAGATVGYLRTYFDSQGITNATSLKFDITGPTLMGRLRVSQVARTNTLASLGSTRQILRTLEVGGSARTQGSLELTHATDALGKAIVYTRPDDGIGYVPALRPSFVSGGTTTTDTTLVSGARNNPTGTQRYERLAAALPDGTYALYARVRSTTADPQTFTWSARAVINSTAQNPVQSGTTTVNYIGSSTWQVVCLGHFRAPLLEQSNPGTDSLVRVEIQQTTSTGSPTCAIDEAWIFEIENGSLTIVECGSSAEASGGSSNRLWLNSPTVDTPRPTIEIGCDSDGNDARYPGPDSVQAFGVHEFRPGSMMVFTVTTNALAASAALSHYERFHTLAAS